MKLLIMAPFFFYISSAMALEGYQRITVKGTTYTQCTVSADSKLKLGKYRSKQWSGNAMDEWNTNYYIIKLEDCDPGTTVKISAEAEYINYNTWLANKTPNSGMHASLMIMKPGGSETGTSGYHLLSFDNSNAYTVIIGSSNLNREIKVRGVLRRDNINTSPAGEFSALVTFNFNFS